MNHLAALASAALLALGTATPAHAAPGDPLKVVMFDFEGGGGTLFVTPNGKTVMIDAAWPAGRGTPAVPQGSPPVAATRSSAQRIADAVKEAGAKRIDYLLLTHYHIDHIGGVAELVKLIPIGTVLDHGENRETIRPKDSPGQKSVSPEVIYPPYVAALAGQNRKTVRAGDVINVDGVVFTITNSNRLVLDRPMAGGGAPVAGCGPVPLPDDDGGEENFRSIGFVATYGRGRVILLGDTNQDVEHDLVCPRNLIGPIDLMIATQHGRDISNYPPLIAGLAPRVVVIPNGQRKGGDPKAYESIAAAVPAERIWQVHEAVKPDARNTDATRIANPAGVPDATHPILASIARDGSVSITNPRTGRTVDYPKGR